MAWGLHRIRQVFWRACLTTAHVTFALNSIEAVGSCTNSFMYRVSVASTSCSYTNSIRRLYYSYTITVTSSILVESGAGVRRMHLCHEDRHQSNNARFMWNPSGNRVHSGYCDFATSVGGHRISSEWGLCAKT